MEQGAHKAQSPGVFLQVRRICQSRNLVGEHSHGLTLWGSLHCPVYGFPDGISESQQEFSVLFYQRKDRQGMTGEEVVHMSDVRAAETESTGEGRRKQGSGCHGICLMFNQGSS